MRWTKKKRRFTVGEIAEACEVNARTLGERIRREEIDMSDAEAVIELIRELVVGKKLSKKERV